MIYNDYRVKEEQQRSGTSETKTKNRRYGDITREKFKKFEERLEEITVKDMETEEIAKWLRFFDEWNGAEELMDELLFRADMVQEYEEADEDTWESVIEKAAEKLGVDIY